MSELMNLNMVLPEPLNPPFPARASLQELGRVHFVGIGGAGMSAIATLMLKAGIPVSGSDRAETATIQALREAGARVYTPKMLRIFTILIPLLSQRPFTKITPN